MHRIPFLILLCIAQFAFSQRPDHPGGSQGSGLTGSISGMLIDSITGVGIPYASVGLLDQATTKVVNGAVSDDNGSFRISEVPAGVYTLQVVYIGYSNKEISD